MDQSSYDEDNPNLDGDYKAVVRIRNLKAQNEVDNFIDGERAAAASRAAAKPGLGAAARSNLLGVELLRHSSVQTLRLALFIAAEGDDVETLKSYLSGSGGGQRIDRSLADSRFREAESGETVLHRALARGSLKVAQLLLASEHAAALARAAYDVEVGGEVSRRTCLHQATEAGRLDVVQLLLGAVVGRDERAALLSKGTIYVPHGRRPREVTCLHIAAMNGYSAIVEYLVGECGVDVNESSGQKDTALMWASLDGRRETVELLIRLRADVNARNDQGSTALHYAIRNGHLDVASLLIVSGGADVNARRKRGLVCPLVLAATMGYESMVGLLIKSGADVNVRIHGDETALHYAAGEGHLGVCQTLIDAGIEIEAIDSRGETAFLEAALHGEVGAVQLLLNEGANVNSVSLDQQSAWKHAVEAADERMLQVLLDHVSRLAAADVGVGGTSAKALAATSMLSMRLMHRVHLPDGVRPLHLAAARGDARKLRLMLDSQLDAEARDAHGNTFLHVAAASNRWQLLEEFADGKLSSAANDEGNTALHEACRLSHDESVAVLLSKTRLHERNKSSRTVLHEAARAPDARASTVRLVVSQIQQGHYWELLDAADERGYTALHWAVSEGNRSVLRELKSLRLTDLDEDGNTPLHLAAAAGDAETFAELLRLKPNSTPDLGTANDAGMTLARLAVHRSSAAILELLIGTGADVSALEPDGQTLLHWLVGLLKADESMAKIYMQAVRVITDLAVLWWTVKSKKPMPVHTSLEYDDMRAEALRVLFGSTVDKNGHSVLQHAATLGCAPMIKHILNLKNVYKLKSGNFDVYDVTDLTPSTVVEFGQIGNKVHPTAPAIQISHHREKDSSMGERGAVVMTTTTTTSAPTTKAPEMTAAETKPGASDRRYPVSLIELIVSTEDPLSAAAILGMHPIADMVRSYWSAYQWMYACAMLLHLAFVILLTAYSKELQKNGRAGINMTYIMQSNAVTMNCSHLLPPTFTQYVLVIEPVLLLFIQLLQVLSLAWRGGASAMVASAFSSADRTAFIGPLLLRLCGTVHALATIAWLIMYRYCVVTQDYMLSLALLFGWLFPLNFTSGFEALHQFSLMLRHMIFEDIMRFLTVYAFVLFGFGFSQHVILSGFSDYSSYEIQDTLFTTFQWLIGMSNFWDKPTDGSLQKRYGFLAALYIFYSVMSTIVLINLLIAMMSDSYTGIKSNSELLWKVASIELALDTQKSLAPLEPILRCVRSRLRSNKGVLTFDQDRRRWYLRLSKTRRVGPKKRLLELANIDPALVQLGQKMSAIQEQLDSLAGTVKHLLPKVQDEAPPSMQRVDHVSKVGWKKMVNRMIAKPPQQAGDKQELG